MRIRCILITNFRGLDRFQLEMAERSITLIGENGSGKTTVLAAIARAFGRERRFSKSDFGDPEAPIEVEVTLGDLTDEQKGVFADEIDFAKPITLAIGVRAVWDLDAEAVEVTHGFPRRDWKKTRREQREALPFESLPGDRDVGGMLQLGPAQNLLGRLAQGEQIQQSIEESREGIQSVRDHLSNASSLQALLAEARTDLAGLVPGIGEDVFSIESSEAARENALRDLQLCLSHHGDPVAISSQSNGLAQLAAFAFAMQLVRKKGITILMIDEPETSLHPQAQRALMRTLGEASCQAILATHSPNLLDRTDPRQVVRLFRRGGGAVETARPEDLTEEAARKFIRFTTPQTAEAFFAQGVILVEGPSDKLAIEAAADRLGINLDSEGLTIVALRGGGSIATFLGMFGPKGFDLRLAGLCDLDSQANWAGKLVDAGLAPEATTEACEEAGFFVCTKDLEDELISAVGVNEVHRVLQDHGDGSAFEKYAKQPKHCDKTMIDQLRGFLARRGRKLRYAPILVDHLEASAIPPPLLGVLRSVTKSSA